MKAISKDEAVALEVERWAGTPFKDQASQKGVGCDCKGLLWGVARDLGFPEAESFYAAFIHYDLGSKRGLPHGLLVEGFEALFGRADEIKPGRILLLNRGGKPSHIAIASRNEGRAWHAQIGPKDWVKEASIKALTHPSMFPLHSVWRWRDG